MVVANEESALILQVEMVGETFCTNFINNLLFGLFKKDSPPLVQLLGMMGRQIKNGGKDRGRRRTCRVHVPFPDGMLPVGIVLNLVKHGKQAATKVALIGVFFV